MPITVTQLSHHNSTSSIILNAAGATNNARLSAIILTDGSITPPGGWTLVDSILDMGRTVYVYEKVAGPAEGSHTWSLTGAGVGFGTLYQAADSSGSTPNIIADTIGSTGNAQTSFAALSLTFTDVGKLLCHWIQVDFPTATLTPPGSMSGITGGTIHDPWNELGAVESITLAGATGTRTASSTNNATWYAASVGFIETAAGGSMDPILVGTGSLADRIMAGLISQGFTTGSLVDREKARLLAKLLLPSTTQASLHDLYKQANEPYRLLGIYGGSLP